MNQHRDRAMQKAITLAALLHDIGKVGQRAETPSSKEMHDTWDAFVE